MKAYLQILKGYGKLLRGVVLVAAWVAALAALSAIITLPLWLVASRFPTVYTTVSLIVVVAGITWLLLGGQRPSGGALFWVGTIMILLLGVTLGWYVLIALALLVITGMIAYRLA